MNKQEKGKILLEIIKRFLSRFVEQGKGYIGKRKDAMKVYEIEIEHINEKHKV